MVKRGIREVFAENLKWWIHFKGMSQNGFAKRAKFTPSMVSRWCNGHVFPEDAAIDKIARTLKVPFMDLFSD